jgi:Na+-transporting NADH:ubiquinone oxidoreductase subunit NqrB
MSPGTPSAAARPRLDPRWYQIAALSGLLVHGMFVLDFDVRPLNALSIFAGALLTQWVGGRLSGVPRFDFKSALISAVGLCLWIRADLWWLAALTGVASIASKFVLRWNGKHIWNPTNFGVVFMLIASGGLVWTAPGQWGSVAFFAFAMIAAGGLVVNRSARGDVALTFFGAWAVILFARAAWIGLPWTIPFHQLQSGALLLFTFHMITDPRTTPASRRGRILFSIATALGAAFVQFVLFRQNGLLWSLFVCTIAVPLLDRIWPGDRFEWSAPTTGRHSKGVPHAPPVAAAVPAPVRGARTFVRA